MSAIYIPTLSNPIELSAASPVFAQWIEERLAAGGYLPADQVNGQLGSASLKAFAEFKEDVYLDSPTRIGQSAIDLLAKLSERDRVSEQSSFTTVKPLPSLGKTGRSETLPLVGLVYADEEIVKGCRLTWGEMTRGLTRLPAGSSAYGSEEQLVRNMIATAKAFGQVRDKFGSAIAINSSYRPYFLKIGASKSQHKYARGLDVRPLNGDWKKLLECIKAIDSINGVGLGKKLGFWHMDIRPGDRVIFAYA